MVVEWRRVVTNARRKLCTRATTVGRRWYDIYGYCSRERQGMERLWLRGKDVEDR